MNTIEISNIGPIREIKLDLNKVNIFMGAQGSGKSTLAKIISYCSWVEKFICINQSFGEYQNEKSYFVTRLESFHKLKGYIKENSCIKYSSDVLEFELKDEDFSVFWKDKYSYRRRKISYIPAERNMVILPEVGKISFPENYIRSFLFDWMDARKLYSAEAPLNLINLDLQYYYSNFENYIKNIDEQNQYRLLLENASSGIQSIVPLMTMVDYLTDKIYKVDSTISYEIDESRRSVNNELFRSVFLSPTEKYLKNSKVLNKGDEVLDILEKIIDKIDEYPEIKKIAYQYNKIKDNLNNTRESQLIIEEPEQNLFPDTQRYLINYILQKVNNPSYNHTLTLTTHSPYILYCINNCIMANSVHERLSAGEKSVVKCLPARIDGKLISIYQIKNGEIENIQDEGGLIQSNFLDEQMSEIMDDFYVLLNHI